MGAKEAFYNRIRLQEEKAKEEGRKPNTRLVDVPKSMRPTQESIKKTGRKIAWAIRHNPRGSRYYNER